MLHMSVCLQGLLEMKVLRVFLFFKKLDLAGENICRANFLDSVTLGLKFVRVLLVCGSVSSQIWSLFLSLSFVPFVIKEENHWSD